MIKFVRKKITSKDEFGKGVSLNIDGDEEHKTWFGGFVTLSITALMALYVFLLFRKMILHEEDVLNYIYPDISPEELDEIPMKEVHEMIFFELTTNFRHGDIRNIAHEKIAYNEDFHRSLDVKFEQVDVDLDNEIVSERVKYTEFEARPCTKEDFLEDLKDEEAREKNTAVWEKFENELLLCPETEDKEAMSL